MADQPSSPGKKSFHKHVEKAIASRGVLSLHYRKMNGRLVKRKIEPYSMNGNTLIAYDHKRKAVRSFRMERVKHMEKAALSKALLARAAEKARSDAHSTMATVSAFRGKGVPRQLMEGVVIKRLKQAHKFEGGAPSVERARAHMYQMAKGASAFWQGFEKAAGAVAELAGLGMLAVPSVQHLRGKPLKEDTAHKLELAGLGTLAAPYAVSAAKGAYHKAKPLLSHLLRKA